MVSQWSFVSLQDCLDPQDLGGKEASMGCRAPEDLLVKVELEVCPVWQFIFIYPDIMKEETVWGRQLNSESAPNRSNQICFILDSPKSQSHPLIGLYNLYSEQILCLQSLESREDNFTYSEKQNFNTRK